MTELVTSFDSQQQRALDLLSSGCTPEQTASALGISVSRISQYCSSEEFAGALATRKFEALRKHNARDAELDSLEDSLIAQLKRLAPLALRPMEAARLFSIVNSAKRRGQSDPTSIHEQTTVVRLTIPVQIVNRFSVDTNNQVISTGLGAGQQELITIQSGQMTTLASSPPPLLQGQQNEPKRLTIPAATTMQDFGFA